MKVNKLFLETIINYTHSASKDETRPFLQTVAIRRKSNSDTIELTATDGHIAIRSEHKVVANDLTANDGEYYLIPTYEIEVIKLYLKKYKRHNIFELEINYPYLSLGINQDCQDKITIKLLERDYPKIDPIYDNNKTCELSAINLNPDFIYNLRKSVYGTLKGDMYRHKFTFAFTSELGPLKCKCKHNGIEHSMLLMPIKAD